MKRQVLGRTMSKDNELSHAEIESKSKAELSTIISDEDNMSIPGDNKANDNNN